MKNARSRRAPAVLFVIAILALAGQHVIAGPEGSKARINGFPPNPAQDVFEIRFIAIDGQDIIPSERLSLEPGTYTITARIPAQYTRAAVEQRRRSWSEDVDFEMTVEADAVYRLRGQWNRGNLDQPYELVFEQIR